MKNRLLITLPLLLLVTSSASANDRFLEPQAPGVGEACGGIAGIACQSGLFCDYSALECNIADGQGVCRQGGACPAVYLPVCSCSGRTFGNLCELAQAGHMKAYDGPCITGACTPSQNSLCLDSLPGDKRFAAMATFRRDESSPLSPARAFPLVLLGISRAGLFWFFQEDNPEILVRVLNGCALNNRYWVFASAGTTVEYSLTVVDSKSNRARQYHNPLGKPSPAILDTNAFATCP